MQGNACGDVLLSDRIPNPTLRFDLFLRTKGELELGILLSVFPLKEDFYQFLNDPLAIGSVARPGAPHLRRWHPAFRPFYGVVRSGRLCCPR